MKLVSIIMPTYNCKIYLDESISSVLNQTYKNIEFIIINDGSNDESDLVIKKYLKDKRIKYINQENFGMSQARNNGLEIASGQYIYFVDADDRLESDCIERCVRLIETYNCDVIINGFYSDKRNSSKQLIKMMSRIDLLTEVAKSSDIQNFCWGKLYKKELFDEIRFPLGRCFEDIFIMCQLFSKCNNGGCYLDSQLYYYRVRNNSESKHLNIKKLNDFCDSLIFKFNFLSNISLEAATFMVESIFQFKCLLYELRIKKHLIRNIDVLNSIYLKSVKMLPKKNAKYKVLCHPFLCKMFLPFKKQKNIIFDSVYTVKPYELREIKRIELSLLSTTIDIIEELGLRYFCVGGTALGAYKYNGFIPWDDDIDIAMPRLDFEIFKKSFSKCAKNKDVFIQSNVHDNKYPLEVAKVRKKGTAFTELSTSKLPIKSGIFIDVFPIDYLERKKLPILNRIRNLKIYNYVIEKDRKTTFKFIILRALSVFVLGSRVALSRRNDAVMYKKNNEENANYCYLRTQFVNADYFNSYDFFEFEGLRVKLPKNAQNYLTECFGNISIDPPKEQQIPHHFVVDLAF